MQPTCIRTLASHMVHWTPPVPIPVCRTRSKLWLSRCAQPPLPRTQQLKKDEIGTQTDTAKITVIKGTNWSDLAINQGTPRTANNHQKVRKMGKDFFLKIIRKSTTLLMFQFQTFSLKSCGRIFICYFKSPSLRYFVMATTGYQYRNHVVKCLRADVQDWTPAELE